jgi:threonine dehydratase
MFSLPNIVCERHQTYRYVASDAALLKSWSATDRRGRLSRTCRRWRIGQNFRRRRLAGGPDEVPAFHDRMPAHAATLLLDASGLAERFDVGRVAIKVEKRPMGVPSFKILGASWATYRSLCEHIGSEPEPWNNIDELSANLAHLRPFTQPTATVVALCRSSHASSASNATSSCRLEWLVPASLRWNKKVRPLPPMGVGAFMPAAATHHRSGEYRPVIDGVEPIDANDVQVSALEGDITHVAWPHRSIMVGLNCGRLSPPQRSP